MPEKFRNQVRFQNGQLIDLAILKPGFELDRPFQNQGRFQNGQVNDLAVSKWPGFQNGQEHMFNNESPGKALAPPPPPPSLLLTTYFNTFLERVLKFSFFSSFQEKNPDMCCK